MRKHRSFRRTVLYGAIVGVLFLVAIPVSSLAGIRGIEAIHDDEAPTVIVSWLISLGAAIVPVLALALYLHWLGATSRDAEREDVHIPTRVEDWLFGIGTTVAALAAVPILWLSYRGSIDAFGEGDLAFTVGYGVLGVVYFVFALFCVERYVQWMR